MPHSIARDLCLFLSYLVTTAPFFPPVHGLGGTVYLVLQGKVLSGGDASPALGICNPCPGGLCCVCPGFVLAEGWEGGSRV